MNAIEIKGLKKSFRCLYALDGLNMTVPVGAIYGFIGENGSGKSTTEKLICGHLVPDNGLQLLFRFSGNVAFLGFDPYRFTAFAQRPSQATYRTVRVIGTSRPALSSRADT